MANTTTVTFPAGYTAFTAWNIAAAPAPFPAASGSSTSTQDDKAGPTAAQTAASSTITRDGGFTLFLRQAIDEQVVLDVGKLIDQLRNDDGLSVTDFSAWFNGTSQITNTVPITLPSGFLAVPVISQLQLNVDLTSLTSTLDSAYKTLVASVPPTPGVSSTGSAGELDSSSTPTSVANSNTLAPSVSSSIPFDPTGVSDASISTSTLAGAAAGAAIGGLLCGAAICLLVVVYCFKRRRSDRTSSDEKSSPITPVPAAVPEAKAPRALARSLSVVGWQKHLPQEKDDRTIRTAFLTLFQQVQMYVEDNYGEDPVGLPSEAAALLRNISEDGLHKEISRAKKALPILEGVLARYIVHRISLRSSREESLLPAEFTGIPSSRNWHMERDQQHEGPRGGMERGIPQALSDWRMLTGFLRGRPQADNDFTKALNAKVNKAAHEIDEAFAPWRRPDKSATARLQSCTSILLEASKAGVLLFGQRTLYVFDWTRHGHVGGSSFAVTPALVKELDEHGEPLNPADVLINARSDKDVRFL